MTSHKLSERLEIDVADDGSAILCVNNQYTTPVSRPESKALYAALREFWAPEPAVQWRPPIAVPDDELLRMLREPPLFVPVTPAHAMTTVLGKPGPARRTPTIDDLDSQARRDAFQDPVAKAIGAVV